MSNDPGNLNIMWIIACDTLGKILFKKKLTRKFYYHASGINEQQRKTLQWNKSLAGLFESLSIHHFKTADLTAYGDSIINYRDNFGTIWERMAGSRKWSHAKFRLHRNKTKVIDTFLESLIPRNGLGQEIYDKPHMYYGSGQFPSGGRGQKSVPLKYIKKRCQNFFHCWTVNEFRTSQVCHHCGLCRLCDVVKVSPDAKKKTTIRGLKSCPSIECKHNPMKNRDEVGSSNIMMRGLGNDNTLFDRKLVPWKNRSPKQVMIYTRTNIGFEE